MSDEEIRLEAKEAGIKSWHNKNIDKLKAELSDDLDTPVDALTAADLDEQAAIVHKPKPDTGKRVLMVLQQKGDAFRREWIMADQMQAHLGRGWVVA
jgi:hypothetical protein